MIPIYLPFAPHDEKMLHIIYQNTRLMLLCIFEENFQEFENTYETKREKILFDDKVTKDFASWINQELWDYGSICEYELSESYLKLYCTIRSTEPFELDEHPLISDLLFGMIARAKKYHATYPEAVTEDPACATRKVRSDTAEHVVGRRITPKEDREYVRNTYKRYRKNHKHDTVSTKEFLNIVETVDCLDAMLNLFPRPDVTYNAINEQNPLFLPPNWWDPIYDMSLFNKTIRPRPGDYIIRKNQA